MRRLLKILCLIFSVLLVFSGCGEINPPDKKDENSVAIVIEDQAQYKIAYKSISEYPKAILLSQTLQNVTGIPFACEKVDSSNAVGFIFINQDYNAMVSDGPRCLSNGYAYVYNNGSIYLCAYDSDVMLTCYNKFAKMLKDNAVYNNQKADIKLEKEKLTQLFNPSTLNGGAYLLDKDLSYYTVVISENATYSEKLVINQFIKDVELITGYKLNLVTDKAEERENEIVLGKTTRAQTTSWGAYGYSVQSKDGKIFGEYENYLTAPEVANQILKSISQEPNSNPIFINDAIDDNSDYYIYKQSKDDVRVMSSNILNREGTTYKDYSYEERLNIMTDCYNLYMPDFIGLQETDYVMQPLLKKYLDPRYEYIAFKNDTGINNYTPMLYRSDLWQMEDNYLGYTDRSTMWRLQWGVFTRKGTDQKVVFMNTHLHYAGPSMQAELAQEINAELKELHKKYPLAIFFLTGDYNASATDSAPSLMFHGLSMKSSQLLTNDNSVSTGGSTHHIGQEPDNNGIIDHVGVSYNTGTVRVHRIIRHKPLIYASDHFPVFCDVYYR